MSSPLRPATPRQLARKRLSAVRSPLERLRALHPHLRQSRRRGVVGLYLCCGSGSVWSSITASSDCSTSIGCRTGASGAASLVVLVSGLAAAAALTVVTRLFREFRDAALALVLERRYPQILGDRLITAVELADPAQRRPRSVTRGPWCRRPFTEAAQRVIEQLNIQEVFDWRPSDAASILIGVLVWAATSWRSASCPQRRSGQRLHSAGFTQFHDVSGIWFEHNILLHNVIWPRQAHLQYLDPLPVYGEYRIRQKAIRAAQPFAFAPEVHHRRRHRPRVRRRSPIVSGSVLAQDRRHEQESTALRFGQKPSEGRRPLNLVRSDPETACAFRCRPYSPTDRKERNLGAGLTLDEIELNLDKTETHRTLAAETKAGHGEVLDQLESRTADPAMEPDSA